MNKMKQSERAKEIYEFIKKFPYKNKTENKKDNFSRMKSDYFLFYLPIAIFFFFYNQTVSKKRITEALRVDRPMPFFN